MTFAYVDIAQYIERLEYNGSNEFDIRGSKMATITLRAHFDGERIRLDEPFELKPNTQLLVTVLPSKTDEEYEDWALLSVQGLGYAYADDEIEYPLSLIKEVNPDYEGR